MDIFLSENIIDILKRKVKEGCFSSLDDAVAFAVRFAFLENKMPKEDIIKLNKEIEKGWQDMENGLGINSKDLFEKLRKKYV